MDILCLFTLINLDHTLQRRVHREMFKSMTYEADYTLRNHPERSDERRIKLSPFFNLIAC
jgi:hypothetical protein